MPMTFADPADYDRIEQGDVLELPDIRKAITDSGSVKLINKTKNEEYKLNYEYSDRQRAMILAGGLLNYTKANGGNN